MGYKVKLNVYDLSNGMAAQFSPMFLGKRIDGIWHTGVVIYGYEFYFGGGICKDRPNQTPYGTPVREIDLGETEIDEGTFMSFLREISSRFTVNTYNILKHNCNNFSDEACQFLLGKGIPDYITGLPAEVMNTQMGRMIEPMINQMQDTVISGSHPIFESDQGGIMDMTNQGSGNAGGLGGLGGLGGGAGAGGMPDLSGVDMNQLQNLVSGFSNMDMSQFGGAAGGAGGLGGMGAAAGAGNAAASSSASSGTVTEAKSVQELNSIIGNHKAVIVDFWHPGCGPCVRFAPTYSSMASSTTYSAVKFVKINIAQVAGAGQMFGIRAYPTFLVFSNGQKFDQVVGANQKAIEGVLNRILPTLVNKSKHEMIAYKTLDPKTRSPALFSSKNMEKIAQKIGSLIEEGKITLDEKEKEILLKWKEEKDNFDINEDFLTTLITTITNAGDDTVFCFIDLLRIYLLEESVAKVIAGLHWDKIRALGTKYMNEGAAKAAIIMTSKMLVNCFAHEATINKIKDDIPFFMDLIVSAVNYAHKSVRHAASLFAFNLRMFLGTDAQKIYDYGTEAIAALSFVCAEEEDNEALYGLLMAIGVWIYNNDDLCEVVQSLDAIATFDAIGKKSQEEKVQKAVSDIKAMLAQL